LSHARSANRTSLRRQRRTSALPNGTGEASPKSHRSTKKQKRYFAVYWASLTKNIMDLATSRNNVLTVRGLLGLEEQMNPEASEFMIHKMSVSKSGVDPMELPKNAEQLDSLSVHCRKVGAWIASMLASFIHGEAGPFRACTHKSATSWSSLSDDKDVVHQVIPALEFEHFAHRLHAVQPTVSLRFGLERRRCDEIAVASVQHFSFQEPITNFL
jgi:hypothetical protein